MEKLKPNNETGKYIFLSYPHINDDQAFNIIEALQNDGYRVWFDESLELGTRYNEVIAEHIENCEVFMAFLTTDYYKSDYCRMEFNFALEECKKPIIPVFMGSPRQIKNSFPAGMRMFLAGVNAFMMGENMNIVQFMRKVKESKILDICRAEPEDTKPEIIEPVTGKEEPLVAKVSLIDNLLAIERKDIVTFGNYWQDKIGEKKSPIEWIVLIKQGNKALLLSKYALDVKPYNEQREDTTWEKCTLREWLNRDFFNAAFNEKERSIILTSRLTNEKNPEYDADPGNDTDDMVFMLSITEARNYFENNENRGCQATAYSTARGIVYFEKNKTSWWLRSLGRSGIDASLVLSDGSINLFGYGVRGLSVGVRPALWVDLGFEFSEK